MSQITTQSLFGHSCVRVDEYELKQTFPPLEENGNLCFLLRFYKNPEDAPNKPQACFIVFWYANDSPDAMYGFTKEGGDKFHRSYVKIHESNARIECGNVLFNTRLQRNLTNEVWPISWRESIENAGASNPFTTAQMAEYANKIFECSVPQLKDHANEMLIKDAEKFCEGHPLNFRGCCVRGIDCVLWPRCKEGHPMLSAQKRCNDDNCPTRPKCRNNHPLVTINHPTAGIYMDCDYGCMRLPPCSDDDADILEVCLEENNDEPPLGYRIGFFAICEYNGKMRRLVSLEPIPKQ